MCKGLACSGYTAQWVWRQKVYRDHSTVYLRNHGGRRQDSTREANERRNMHDTEFVEYEACKESVISIKKESWFPGLDSWVVCTEGNLLRRADILSSGEKGYDDFSVAILSLRWLYDFQGMISNGTLIKSIWNSAKTWERILGKW